MLIDFQHDADSILLRFKILDSSVSTGAGLTGLTSSSAGLIISTIADNEETATTYSEPTGTIETITELGTYVAPAANNCRFKEVDASFHPGVCEVQFADARFAVSSAKSLLVSISGATNCAETDFVIPLRGGDPFDSMRGGLTALPDAAADANNGLVTGDGSVTFTAGASNRPAMDMVAIHGTNLTETDGQLAAAFVKLLDVATPLLVASVAMVDLSTLETRLSAARANLLDNIPGGTMPTQAEVLSIQNNTRTTIGIPTVAERPDADSTGLKIYLNNYDTVGNMEVPDSAPTVAVVNEEGTSRSGNLQHPTTHGAQTTMVNLSAGRYWIEYDLDNADSLESLTFTFSIIEGGTTRVIDRVMFVVDTTGVGFTAADRTLLQDVPSTSEFEARTIVAASYFDPTSANVTTDGASRTASKADVSALATTAALTTVGNNVVLVLADTGTDGVAVASGSKTGYTLTSADHDAIADALLNRGASNIEDSADKHSLGAVTMIITNSSVSGDVLTAKKPSDDSTFETYDVTSDADADPITGVS